MNVVVTGGAGFIGSAAVRALVAAEHRVRVVDNLSTGRRENLEDVVVEWNVADAAEVDYSDCQAVVHCAAYPDIRANWDNREERDRQWENNANLTRKVLELLPLNCRFVLLSTAAVYGGGEVDESSPTHATSPYVASKLASESIAQSFAVAGRVSVVILRLVNVFGPRYRHGHVADFVKQMRERGAIHALTDGHVRKSAVHVSDVAEAVVRGLFTNASPPYNIDNVTSEVVWSWRDTVALMVAMSGEPIEVTCESNAVGWIGDPPTLTVAASGGMHRSVVDGVRETLLSLGWGN